MKPAITPASIDITVSYAVQQHVTAKQARQIDKMVNQASHEQLANLYERIQAERQLGAGSSNRLLLFDVAPSQEP